MRKLKKQDTKQLTLAFFFSLGHKKRLGHSPNKKRSFCVQILEMSQEEEGTFFWGF